MSAPPPPLSAYHHGSGHPILVHDPAFVDPTPGLSSAVGAWVHDVAKARRWWVPWAQLVPVRDPVQAAEACARYRARVVAEEAERRSQEEQRAREEEESLRKHREQQEAARLRAELLRRQERYAAALARAKNVLHRATPLLGPRGIRAQADDVELAISWCTDPEKREVFRPRLEGEFVRWAGRDMGKFALLAAKRHREAQPDEPPRHHDLLARMLSARLAERAAQGFYESADPALLRPDGTPMQVEDISILQDTHDPRFTREYDLRYPALPDRARKHVDVKNTRRDARDRLGYTHHRVNKLRRLHDRSAVVITGVVSDALPLHALLAEHGVPAAEILGETDRDRLEALEKEFRLDALRIDLRGPEGVEYVLPPWVFDAPDFVDAAGGRALDELRDALAWLREMQPAAPLPDLQLCLAAGIGPEGAEWNQLSDPVRTLAQEWAADARTGRLTLARLYLSVLRAFFRQVAAPDGVPFDAPTVRALLYLGPPSPADGPEPRPPLGVRDPLACVHGLLATLELLQKEGLERLRAYRTFEFRGPGELYGALPGERGPAGWTLMFPYCGKPDCRCTRLQLGTDPLCLECKRLQCRECGFCHCAYRQDPGNGRSRSAAGAALAPGAASA